MFSNQSPLVNGIAVIIDDEIGTGDAIDDLISQIKSNGIPYRAYDDIPCDINISHFHGVSFILLDWRLKKKEIGDTVGILIPDSILQPSIDFLRAIKEKLFVPVFIFTNESPNDVQERLCKEKLYVEGKPSFIFIQSKSELTGDRLFARIDDWIKNNPPVYVLKTWEHEYRAAQIRVFAELYGYDPSWVTVLKKCFEDDKSAVSVEIMSLIRDNISARMQMNNLEEDCLGNEGGLPDKKQIRSILEHSRFIENSKLPKDEVRCGDVFLNDDKYFINIRPDCDCIPNRNDPNSTIDAVELYLLEGSIVYKNDIPPLDFNVIIEKLQVEERKKTQTENDENKPKILEKQQKILETAYNTSLLEKFGHFHEQLNEVIVPFMYQGHTFSFKFRRIKTIPFNEAGNRIGRLLPPFVTHIRTKYAQYLLRQGLPRIPAEAVSPKRLTGEVEERKGT